MHLFRSEEHLQRWLEQSGLPRGGTMTTDTCWRLARLWYAGKNTLGYRRKSPQEAQAAFASLGLTGEFWRVT